MSKLLVIVPGKYVMHDCMFHLLVADTGEHIAQHCCSGYGFAYNDLYGNNPELIEELAKRFGEVDVKFIDETNITGDVLIERNKLWALNSDIQLN